MTWNILGEFQPKNRMRNLNLYYFRGFSTHWKVGLVLFQGIFNPLEVFGNGVCIISGDFQPVGELELVLFQGIFNPLEKRVLNLYYFRGFSTHLTIGLVLFQGIFNPLNRNLNLRAMEGKDLQLEHEFEV